MAQDDTLPTSCLGSIWSFTASLNCERPSALACCKGHSWRRLMLQKPMVQGTALRDRLVPDS